MGGRSYQAQNKHGPMVIMFLAWAKWKARLDACSCLLVPQWLALALCMGLGLRAASYPRLSEGRLAGICTQGAPAQADSCSAGPPQWVTADWDGGSGAWGEATEAGGAALDPVLSMAGGDDAAEM